MDTNSPITILMLIVKILTLSFTLLDVYNAHQCASTLYPMPQVCLSDLTLGDYPTCGVIDLTYERRICELRAEGDVRALKAIATIAGQVS